MASRKLNILTSAVIVLGSIFLAVGCGSGEEGDSGPAPKFGAAAGPPGQAAGSGGGTSKSAEPATGASTEAK